MAEIDWFPKAQSKPMNGNLLLPEPLRSKRFLSWRNRGGSGKDDLKRWGSVPVGITRKGVDLEGRVVYSDSDGVKLFQSFPEGFEFVGTNANALNRIGDSVPPLMMRAIATRIAYLFFGLNEMKTGGADYLKILEEAWRQHLAPRETGAPTVISLFAGCGGSSLGYSMAGYRELLAVEWDDNAVATFGLNFPDVPIYHGDIHGLTVKRCLEMAGLEPGELDLLDGSPPCQGFSMAGKRRMEDKRNQLYMQFVRLLRGLRPKAFVMENVSGLVKGKMKLVFADIMKELKASGYEVRCKLLNAMYFNVPQSRRRLIWIGARNDLKARSDYPKAESKPRTVREALAGLRDDASSSPAPNAANSVALLMRRCRPGTSLAQSVTKGKYFSWIKASFSKPCQTIQKSVTWGGFSVWHPAENRSLSGRELARCGSYPDGFEFAGERHADWVADIGNSVPPLMMRAIAGHLRTVLERAERHG